MFRRASDNQVLKLGSGTIFIQKSGITFIRQGLSKSDRQNHVNNKIFVPSFSRDSLLDPVRVLKFYLKKKLRSSGSLDWTKQTFRYSCQWLSRINL